MKRASRKNTKLLFKVKHLLLDLYEKLETRTGKRILVTALVFSLIILIMTILIRKTKHNFPEPVTMALMDTTLEDIGDYSDLTTPAIDFDYHSYDKIASDSFNLNQGTCKNPVLGGLLLKSNDSFSPVCLGYFITAKFLIFSSDCKYLADDLSESEIGFDSSNVVLELTDIIRVESIGLKGVTIVELNEPRNDYDGSTCIYEQFDSNMYLVDERNDETTLILNGSNCFDNLAEAPFLLNKSNCLDVPSRLRDYLNGTNDHRRFFFSFVRTETGGQYLNGVYYKSDESGLDEFFPIKKYLNEITDLLENSRKRISFTSSVTAFTTSMSTDERTPESNKDSESINITLVKTTTKATKTITTTSTITNRTTSITTRTITSKITTTKKTVTVTTTPKPTTTTKTTTIRTTITTTTPKPTTSSNTKRTITTTRTIITTITKTRTTSTRPALQKTTSTTTKVRTTTSTTTKKSTTTTTGTIAKYSKSNLPIQNNLNGLFGTNKKLLNFTSSPKSYLTSMTSMPNEYNRTTFNISLVTVNITRSLRSKSRKYSAEANQSYMLNYGDDCPVTLVPMFKPGIAMICVGYQITSKFFIYPNSCIPAGVNLSEVIYIVSPYNHKTSLSDHYRIIDVPYRYDKLSIIEIEPDSTPGTYKINCLQPKNDTTSDITLRSGYRKPNQTGFVHHFAFLSYGKNCFSTKINKTINISTTACENMTIKLREKLNNSSVTYYDRSDFISVIRISNTSNRYFNGIYSMAENPINDVFMPIQSFYNLIEQFLDRKRDEFYNEP